MPPATTGPTSSTTPSTGSRRSACCGPYDPSEASVRLHELDRREDAGELLAHRLRRGAHLVGDDDVGQPLDVDDVDVEIAPESDAAVGVRAEQLGVSCARLLGG